MSPSVLLLNSPGQVVIGSTLVRSKCFCFFQKCRMRDIFFSRIIICRRLQTVNRGLNMFFFLKVNEKQQTKNLLIIDSCCSIRWRRKLKSTDLSNRGQSVQRDGDDCRLFSWRLTWRIKWKEWRTFNSHREKGLRKQKQVRIATTSPFFLCTVTHMCTHTHPPTHTGLHTIPSFFLDVSLHL